MFVRCSRSLANRLLPGRFVRVSACRVVCPWKSAPRLASDISALLFLQKDMRGGEVADREEEKDQHIEPEIRITQSLGEGPDADRLKPARWKKQANQSSRAS